MRKKRKDEPLTFGDVLEADWLYDLYLREGAEALTVQLDGANNIARYLPEKKQRERAGGKDYAVGFATAEGVHGPAPEGTAAEGPIAAFGSRRRAIILSDECETPKILAEGGRLLLAVVVPWPTNPTELQNIRDGRIGWNRHPLPPSETPGEWDGGMVDFSKHIAVWHEAVGHATISWTAAETPVDEPQTEGAEQVDEKHPTDEYLLKVAWATYSTRHGPIAGVDGLRKLLEAHRARTDPSVWTTERDELELDGIHAVAEDAINKLLERIWDLEGKTVDEIADVYEKHGAGFDRVAPQVLEQIAGLRADAEAAEAALRAVLESGETPEAGDGKAA